MYFPWSNKNNNNVSTYVNKLVYENGKEGRSVKETKLTYLINKKSYQLPNSEKECKVNRTKYIVLSLNHFHKLYCKFYLNFKGFSSKFLLKLLQKIYKNSNKFVFKFISSLYISSIYSLFNNYFNTIIKILKKLYDFS